MNNKGKSYCRFCAVFKPKKQIVDLHTDAIRRLLNKLTILNCQIDFSYNNTMPKSVCLACVNSLTRACDFITSVKRAQVVLEEVFPQLHNKKDIALLDHDYSLSEPLVGNFEQIIIKMEPESAESSFQLQKVQDDEHAKIKTEIESDLGRYVDVHMHSTSKAPTLLVTSEKNDVTKKPPRRRKPPNRDTIPTLTWEHYSWTCAYCETQFPSISELSSHSIEYHKACNAYRCSDCKVKRLKLHLFLRHVRSHRKYLRKSCYKCFKTFPYARDAFKHVASHVTSHFKCEGCNVSFSSSKELKTHCDLLFRNKRPSNLLSQVLCNKLVAVPTDGLTCLPCNKKFKSSQCLRSHLNTHMERKRNHVCEICGKCYLFSGNLAEHMLLHDKKMEVICHICKATFKTKKHLALHISVHNQKKPHSCEHCGKRFRLQHALKIHSIIHTDLRPYVCSYCNKGFRFSHILKQHLRQHTGEKPYSCKICARPFTNWPNYYKHMKCRHNINIAKKIQTVDGWCRNVPDTSQNKSPDTQNEKTELG